MRYTSSPSKSVYYSSTLKSLVFIIRCKMMHYPNQRSQSRWSSRLAGWSHIHKSHSGDTHWVFDVLCCIETKRNTWANRQAWLISHKFQRAHCASEKVQSFSWQRLWDKNWLNSWDSSSRKEKKDGNLLIVLVKGNQGMVSFYSSVFNHKFSYVGKKHQQTNQVFLMLGPLRPVIMNVCDLPFVFIWPLYLVRLLFIMIHSVHIMIVGLPITGQ